MIGLSRKIKQGCKVIISLDKKNQKNALQQFTFNGRLIMFFVKLS